MTSIVSKKHLAILSAVLLMAPRPAATQTASHDGASPKTERSAAGDSPEDPGPLATDLSHALAPKDIQTAIRKVADWQIRTAEPRFNQQWTFAPLYDGLI